MPRTCALGVAMLKLCRLIALPAALVAVLLFLSSGQESPARAQFDDPDGDGYADGFESLWGSDGLDGTSTPESLAHDFYFGTTSCSDGSDNDGDGSTDAADSGCTNTDADTDFLGGPLDDGMEVIVGSDATNAASTVEYGLFDEMFGGDTCSDTSDNDLDTLIDSADPGCQDADFDGIVDGADNCPFVYNPGQEDADSDGIGNACDPDFVDSDGDGIVDGADNCPSVYNPGQEDANGFEDGAGAGDACEDPDGDGIVNAFDNCDFVANPGQEDTDFDSIGDACDRSE